MLSDAQLIHAYLSGDESSFEELVRVHTEPTYRFVYSLVRDEALARDIVQETFVKVWKHVDTFDTSRPFSPWILQIEKRTAFDVLRTRSHEISFTDFETHAGYSLIESVVGADISPLAAYEETHAHHTLAHVRSLLPPAYQEVLTLKEEGYTFADIAQKINTPLHTIKSRYRRALLSLRARLTLHQIR